MLEDMMTINYDLDHERAVIAAMRYEKIRRINVSEFIDIYSTAIATSKTFDELVDKLPIHSGKISKAIRKSLNMGDKNV